MHLRRLATALAVAASLAACGTDGGGPSAPTPTAPAQDLAVKPAFEVPSDEPAPAQIEVRTLAEGDGPAVEEGDTLVLHFVGKAWSTGQQFDASWDRGQPYSFTLGQGRVIRGWELGIGGSAALGIAPMRVGERRELVLPPDYGYGDAGAGTDIGPGETLVFVVDLIAIEGG